MKKLILAFVALAFAFAISSCCDQAHCPSNMRCGEKSQQQGMVPGRGGEETPYRWDQPDRSQQNERSTRRW